MIKVLSIFGTRPEAIKMAPVVRALERHPTFESVVGLTGQHEELLGQALDVFGIVPDFNLRVMRPNQDLASLTGLILEQVSAKIRELQPHIVLVQGDTTTAFAASLAAFYCKVPVGHVEAGLRTNDKYQPFPEEISRRLVDQVSDLCFAPTEANRQNLLDSGVEPERIFVTGNTVVDALGYIAGRLDKGKAPSHNGRPTVLVTLHRRESFGEPMQRVFEAVRTLARRFPDHDFLYPVHPNPNVRDAAQVALGAVPNVHLLEPMNYFEFVGAMRCARLILTDSGGVQEEAPSFGKPLLILRDTTERMEIVEAGGALLVGTDAAWIVTEASRLLLDERHYAAMAGARNPFGDGHAAARIVDLLHETFVEYAHEALAAEPAVGAG